MIVTRYEIALFPKENLKIPSQSELLQEIKKNLPDEIKERKFQETILPIPESQIEMIPTIFLNSNDGYFQLQIVGGRLSVAIENAIAEVDLEKFKSLINAIQKVEALSGESVKYKRVGFITTGLEIFESADLQEKLIKEKILNQKAAEGISALNLQATYVLDEFSSVVTVGSVENKDSGQKGMMLQVDVNNPLEKPRDDTYKDAKDWIFEDRAKLDEFNKYKVNYGLEL